MNCSRYIHLSWGYVGDLLVCIQSLERVICRHRRQSSLHTLSDVSVLRHSALTEKSAILNSDSKLRQHAGWTANSDMHSRYVHFPGGESMDDLLKLKGIVKDDKPSMNVLKPKECPHCRELNRPDVRFCSRCNFVMSFEAYHNGVEERERNDKVIQELKEQVEELRSSYEDLIKRNVTVSNFTKDGVEIFDGFGNSISSRPLTKEERKSYLRSQYPVDTTFRKRVLVFANIIDCCFLTRSATFLIWAVLNHM